MKNMSRPIFIRCLSTANNDCDNAIPPLIIFIRNCSPHTFYQDFHGESRSQIDLFNYPPESMRSITGQTTINIRQILSTSDHSIVRGNSRCYPHSLSLFLFHDARYLRETHYHSDFLLSIGIQAQNVNFSPTWATIFPLYLNTRGDGKSGNAI